MENILLFIPCVVKKKQFIIIEKYNSEKALELSNQQEY